ncbi:hypothetical protein CI102_8486 [Trichoderma harzianum]|uniref:Uncharacterized protein n=1 Tax=Trichoderma harzianum CBS 226.95 TaxID=983964 RepID=A0A2T4AP39_TRIHA|nr:hypothetical protein M431DRAFT_288041 [Trichoderma harzianum CBS 226.95]PKK47477.1 hypothetical protein CI102_8486 [Trichoderma harzianum]PTB58846.1 hypothetical protein M431DRAFT_288041 [Trichoderma harzianum CBS 226.95]
MFLFNGITREVHSALFDDLEVRTRYKCRLLLPIERNISHFPKILNKHKQAVRHTEAEEGAFGPRFPTLFFFFLLFSFLHVVMTSNSLLPTAIQPIRHALIFNRQSLILHPPLPSHLDSFFPAACGNFSQFQSNCTPTSSNTSQDVTMRYRSNPNDAILHYL